MGEVARGTQSATLTSSNTAVTISVDAGTGSDRGAFAFTYWRNNGGHSWSTVTYDSVGMTSRATIEFGGQYRMQMWSLDGPSTGSNDLVLTPTGGTGDAAFCVVGYWFIEDGDMAQWLTDIATSLATGSSNAAGASYTSSQAVAGNTDGFGLFVSGMRDGSAAPTATAGDLVGTLDQATSGAQGALAQGSWTSDGGTDTPTMDWDNDGSDLERRFALVVNSTGGGGGGGGPVVVTTSYNDIQ